VKQDGRGGGGGRFFIDFLRGGADNENEGGLIRQTRDIRDGRKMKNNKLSAVKSSADTIFHFCD